MFFRVLGSFTLILAIISAPVSAAHSVGRDDSNLGREYLRQTLSDCIEDAKNPLNKLGSAFKNNAGKLALTSGIVSTSAAMLFAAYVANGDASQLERIAEFCGVFTDGAVQGAVAQYIPQVNAENRKKRMIFGASVLSLTVFLISYSLVYGTSRTIGLLERKHKQLAPALKIFLNKWDLHRKFAPAEFHAGFEKLAIELKSKGQITTLDDRDLHAIFASIFGDAFIA